MTIVTAKGWQPPFDANQYTIELYGIFRSRDGKDWKIGRQTTFTREAIERAAMDVPEYVRTTMGKQLAEEVRKETGQLWSVGEPVRYRLRDTRWPSPIYIDLPWTWEGGKA